MNLPSLIIDHATPTDILFNDNARGGVPRDYDVQPVEMFSTNTNKIKVIPRSEWSDRIKDQDREESSAEHQRRRAKDGSPMDLLYQGRVPWCWTHSTVGASMLARSIMHLPYVELSAFMPGAVIMNGAMKGGWAALSADFLRGKGTCTKAKWAEGKTSPRLYTDDVKEEAEGYRITYDFVDIALPHWKQNLTFDMLATCLLMGWPCPVDLYWWGHSVYGTKLVEVERDSFGIGIVNSHGPEFGDRGYAVLRGERAIPNGALAIIGMTAAA